MGEIQYDQDFSPEIDKLPKHAGYSVLPARAVETYGTLHYSGVVYSPAERAVWLNRILEEAKYQLGHNYGTTEDPAYPDGYLYDGVILPDGWRVKTRRKPVQLWHCGNAIGNEASYSIHLLLGPNQAPTDAQWAGTLNVIEQLCTLRSIPRVNIVGHNEWPRHNGTPIVSSVYKTLPEQSECPGSVLHQRLAAWRAAPTDPLKARQIPGAGGAYFWCGTGMFDYYYTRVGSRDGLWELGYPLEDEAHATGQNGKPCTQMPFERGWLKYVEGEGVRPALTAEAKAMGW